MRQGQSGHALKRIKGQSVHDDLSRALESVAGLGSEDEYFLTLVRQMPSFLFKSKSDNTVKKYRSYFNRFKLFMQRHGKQHLPARDIDVAIFCVHLLSIGASYNVMLSYVSSVKWFHSLYHFGDPTDNDYVRNLLECGKRSNRKQRCKKDIVSLEVIKKLFVKYSQSQDLSVVRDLAMIVVSYAGFLRYDEMSNIKCCDVKFYDEYVRIVIPKSKTDQYRDGNEILLSKLDSPACPYVALMEYIRLAKVDLESSSFLFRAVFKGKYRSGLKILYSPD
jgi:hypothetical protein